MENLTYKFYRGLQELIEKFIEDIEIEEKLELKNSDKKLEPLVLSKSKNFSVKTYKLNDKEFLLVSRDNIIEKFETDLPINVIGYYSEENIPVYLVISKKGKAEIYEYDGKLSKYSKLKEIKRSKFLCMDYDISNQFLEEVSKTLDGRHSELKVITSKNVKEKRLNLRKIKVKDYNLFNGSVYYSTGDNESKFEIKSKYFLELPNYGSVKENLLVLSDVKRTSNYFETNYLLITNLYKTENKENRKHLIIKRDHKPYARLKVKPALSYYKDFRGNLDVGLAIIINEGKDYLILNIPKCQWKIPLFYKLKLYDTKESDEGFKLREVILKKYQRER